MADILIDRVSGDLALDAFGRARKTEGAEAVIQRLRLRLLRWRGEYILDTRIGVPYIEDVFARKGLTSQQVVSVFRPIIARTAGVIRVTDIQASRDGGNLQITFDARVREGRIGGFFRPSDGAFSVTIL